MKTKPRKIKPRGNFISRTPRKRFDEEMAEINRRHWIRAVLTLLLGLLLLTAWIVAYELTDSLEPPSPQPDLTIGMTPEQYRNTGRWLGFLHYLGSFLFLLLGLGLIFWIFLRIFGNDPSPNGGPLFTGLFGAMIVGLTVAMAAWNYLYIPFVDWAWEAATGHMVPYERYVGRGRSSPGNLSAYKWGENAALLLVGAMIVIVIPAGLKLKKLITGKNGQPRP